MLNPDDENDGETEHERGVIVGARTAWRQILLTAMRELKLLGPEEDAHRAAARLALILNDVRVQLRDVCGRHGDNTWPDDLHPADVIEKHLGRVLDNKATRNRGKFAVDLREDEGTVDVLDELMYALKICNRPEQLGRQLYLHLQTFVRANGLDGDPANFASLPKRPKKD